MRAVIFSGTTEGRRLSRKLADRGVDVVVSVASDMGREEQGSYPGVLVLSGRLTADEMRLMLRGCDLCIDATHPFAEQVSAEIARAATDCGVRLVRLKRAESELPEEAVIVEDAAHAAEVIRTVPGRVLLTTGVKELGAFSVLDPERLVPRILPTIEGLARCEELGIPRRNVIAMQGPFSVELNRALIRQFAIEVLVTKESGALGGFDAKVQAARECGTRLIVIRRPQESGLAYEDVLVMCEELLR